VGQVDDVTPSTELRGVSVINMKCGGSPPNRVEETVNRTCLGMGTDEAPGTSLLRQVVGTVEDCASHGLQQMEMTLEEDMLKRDEKQLCSNS